MAVIINFAGVDLQVNTNGLVAHKIQIVDDFQPWLSTQAIKAASLITDTLPVVSTVTVTRPDGTTTTNSTTSPTLKTTPTTSTTITRPDGTTITNNTTSATVRPLGFDVTMLSGKVIKVYYGVDSQPPHTTTSTTTSKTTSPNLTGSDAITTTTTTTFEDGSTTTVTDAKTDTVKYNLDADMEVSVTKNPNGTTTTNRTKITRLGDGRVSTETTSETTLTDGTVASVDIINTSSSSTTNPDGGTSTTTTTNTVYSDGSTTTNTSTTTRNVDDTKVTTTKNADGTTTINTVTTAHNPDGTTTTTSTTTTTNPDGTTPIVLNNDAILSQLYRKILQTGFDISGTSLPLTAASTIYALYKEHQTVWAKRALIKTKLQDPYITKAVRDVLIAELNTAELPLVALTTPGYSYAVSFAEGASCQFTNWVIGNYTDFVFNVIIREPVV